MLLLLQGLLARLVQTLTALAGSGALLGIASLPASRWLQAEAAANSDDAATAAVVFMLFVAWALTVMGHILRHAVSVPFFAGLAYAVVFLLLSMQVMSSLFPASA